MTEMDDAVMLFAGPQPGPAQAVSYRQGVIVTWNAVTLENRVNVGGTILDNLPLLGVAEADSYSPGDTVGLMVIDRMLCIIGRFVIPATAAADEATALLSRRTASSSIIAQETTSSSTFTDLTTVGPAVTVTVRNTGRLLVAVGCQIQRNSVATWGGAMAPEFSGANVITALTGANTVQARWWQGVVGGGTFTAQNTPYASAVFEGLTPGETTIVAKYRSVEPAVSVDIGRRSLTVTVL